jgi:hypothetical protein
MTLAGSVEQRRDELREHRDRLDRVARRQAQVFLGLNPLEHDMLIGPEHHRRHMHRDALRCSVEHRLELPCVEPDAVLVMTAIHRGLAQRDMVERLPAQRTGATALRAARWIAGREDELQVELALATDDAHSLLELGLAHPHALARVAPGDDSVRAKGLVAGGTCKMGIAIRQVHPAAQRRCASSLLDIGRTARLMKGETDLPRDEF